MRPVLFISVPVPLLSGCATGQLRPAVSSTRLVIRNANVATGLAPRETLHAAFARATVNRSSD